MKSKNQINRLGRRLRDGTATESDLRELAEYRASFAPAYQAVLALIRDRLGVEPIGRPAKSTGATVAKLRRTTIKLSQIQDIAGMRFITSDVIAQNSAVRRIESLFDRVEIDDRRVRPSHGYRAVHAIVTVQDASVEVQIRTSLQQRWAELSEKLSGLLDPAIKYGGGDSAVRDDLAFLSRFVAKLEEFDVSPEFNSDELQQMREGAHKVFERFNTEYRSRYGGE